MPGRREYRAEVERDGVTVSVVVDLAERGEPYQGQIEELGDVVGASAARLAQQAVRLAEPVEDVPF